LDAESRGKAGSVQFASSCIKIRIRIFTPLQRVLGKIDRMSTVGSATSGYTSIGDNRTSVQIALPPPSTVQTMGDAELQAAVNRVAMILYMRAHFEMPPSVTALGGGIFDVLV
jgi:hypothetical protein